MRDTHSAESSDDDSEEESAVDPAGLSWLKFDTGLLKVTPLKVTPYVRRNQAR
jgi:hypothetical protein